MQYFILLIFIVSLYLFLNNIFSFIFALDAYKIHKKRLKELNLDGGSKEEAELREIVDKATKPFITHVLPRFRIKNLRAIEKDLRMAEWDKHMTPIQYASLNIMSKFLGVIAFFVLFPVSKFMGILWGIILFMSVSFLMNNSANNRREKLMIEFPDFIRVTQGFLSAGIPFSQSVEESIKFVGDEWKPILREFVITNNLSGMDAALVELRETVDVFEVKEFISIVRLTLEQGTGAKESFEMQADKILAMLHDIMLIKIGRRRMMGILIQAPLLLANLGTFGLPVVYSFMNMGM